MASLPSSRMMARVMCNVVLASKNEQEVAFAYTAVNRLAQRRQAGQQLTFAYDREARLVGLTNEQGHHYRFELDAAGRVVTETGFDGLVRHYERDAAGQVARVQRPAGRTTAYRYDAAGRVAEVDYNDGQPITYRYDGAGALLAARTATSSVEFERDALGRVIQEKQGAHTLSYRYDARGQRISLISSLGADFSWQHDAMGNLSAVRAGEHWQAHFLHDARGLELQRQCSGGIRLAWSHDAAGRPTSQHIATRQGPVRQRQYQWQGADQLTQIEDSLTGSTQYSYDAIGTLTGARYADGSQDVRLADAVGNLFRTPTLADRQYAPGGQLHQASGTRYRYDEEGNLTQKTTADGQQWRYSWDGGGQLASVGLPSGYTVTFGYDALGRRTSKRYRGRVTRWVWEGNVPLHEWTELAVGAEAGSASEVLTWLFEEGSFAPAAKLTPQAAYSVVADHLGTPLALYDGQGKPTWQAQLDSSGGVRQGRGQAQDCSFHYQGQYEDVETGLYYNRFLYYDPEIRQYISQDPAKLQGGAKPYSYVDNPNAQVDPYDLFPGTGFFSDLKWSGMGHHTVPRAHATTHGLDNLGTKRNSPTWYPYESEVPGSAKIHHDAHLALDQHNVPFNPGAPNANNPGSQAELLSRARTAYQDPALTQKGVLRIPSTGEVVADNVTWPRQWRKP